MHFKYVATSVPLKAKTHPAKRAFEKSISILVIPQNGFELGNIRLNLQNVKN